MLAPWRGEALSSSKYQKNKKNKAGQISVKPNSKHIQSWINYNLWGLLSTGIWHHIIDEDICDLGGSVHYYVLKQLGTTGRLYTQQKSRSLKQTQCIGKTNTLIRSVHPLNVFYTSSSISHSLVLLPELFTISRRHGIYGTSFCVRQSFKIYSRVNRLCSTS